MINVQGSGDDYVDVSKLSIINSDNKSVMYTSNVSNTLSFNLSVDGPYNVYVDELDSGNSVLKSSNVIHLNRNSVLTKLIDAVNAKSGLMSTIVVNAVDRFFENN